MFRLLRGDQAEMIRQILAPENRLQQVNRAISWIRQNFSSPFSIEQVAVEARMSTSSLHQHFREVTAMSPLQYQKQLRLQEARRLILGNAMDAATAAHQVGYDSPSQFSREYRRLFGAPPIRTSPGSEANPPVTPRPEPPNSLFQKIFNRSVDNKMACAHIQPHG
ncbi:AraC family transcriptional regulator [Neorhizobium galegae]|nr:AraC family transcriptional regulator [Neorhizobium galegae]